MHLVVGVARLTLAQLLIAVGRFVPLPLFNRRAVRLCCSAFLAGAGLDDAAIEVLRGMGPAATQVLDEQARQGGAASAIPRLILDMLRVPPLA
jgi:hypothetical protein